MPSRAKLKFASNLAVKANERATAETPFIECFQTTQAVIKQFRRGSTGISRDFPHNRAVVFGLGGIHLRRADDEENPVKRFLKPSDSARQPQNGKLP